MKKIILAALLVPVVASAGIAPCDDNAERRIVRGTLPIASELYGAVRGPEGPSWTKDFSEEIFIYVGDVQTKSKRTYRIGFLTTVWGQACRATNRLLVFNQNGSYIGGYGGLADSPTTIEGATVRFPDGVKGEQSIEFTEGPPGSVLLDGEVHQWVPAPAGL